MSGAIRWTCRLAFRALAAWSRPLAAEVVSWAAGELARDSMWAEMMRDQPKSGTRQGLGLVAGGPSWRN